MTSTLTDAAQLARSLGGDFDTDADTLLTLRQRLAQGRFHLAVLGHFKRGKSTLVNALLGMELLPTSVVPLTSVPTFLRAGETMSARAQMLDGSRGEAFAGGSADSCRAFLARFVTEEANPRNGLGVSFVEVFHPAPLLKQGAVVIDTPGIGSTYRHNTEATLNFLPQCDAALFVLSADPPLTEVEVEFLKTVRAKVARLFFILNKVDYLSEADRQVALAFLRKVLGEQVGLAADVPIFCASARTALEARKTGDARRWQGSGMAEVEHHLTHFLMTEKAATLARAVERKSRDVLDDILLRLNLTIRSLQVPLTELDARLGTFTAKMDEAEKLRAVAIDLLEGDQKRMREFVEQQAEQLRRKARAQLDGMLAARAQTSPDGLLDEAEARGQIADTIPGFFEHALGDLGSACRERLNAIFQSHQQRAHELVESVRRAAAESFDLAYQPRPAEELIAAQDVPYWVTHQWTAELATIPPELVDRLLPLRIRRARVHRRLLEEAHTLVIRNVENLRWTTIQNLDQTFRRFSTALDEDLRQTIAATRAALAGARRERTASADTVDRKLAELPSAIVRLQSLLERLKPPAGVET